MNTNEQHRHEFKYGDRTYCVAGCGCLLCGGKGCESCDSRLSCYYCGNDITRKQQAAGDMRYIAGDICAFVHLSCFRHKQQEQDEQ